MASGKSRKLLEPGTHAPDFRLPQLNGGEISLREIAANGPALIAFFKISCPVCQLTFPFIERIHTPAKLPVYGISQNDADDTRGFAQRFGVNFPVLLDTKQSGFAISNAFGISSVPTMFLIERDGTISRVFVGWRKQEIDWLAAKAGVSAFRKGENLPEWKAG